MTAPLDPCPVCGTETFSYHDAYVACLSAPGKVHAFPWPLAVYRRFCAEVALARVVAGHEATMLDALAYIAEDTVDPEALSAMASGEALAALSAAIARVREASK